LTLVAGIDHVKFTKVSAGVIRNQIKSAMAQAGNTKSILAPVAPCLPSVIHLLSMRPVTPLEGNNPLIPQGAGQGSFLPPLFLKKGKERGFGS